MRELSITELAGACGGGASWDAYVKSQRGKVAPAYKQVVCTAAGVKGGDQLASGVYGADRTTDADRIRGAESIKGVCLGGSSLPAAAPQSPF